MSKTDHAKRREILRKVEKEFKPLPKGMIVVADYRQVQCWCRKCRQYKTQDEMFAGVIHPDGIGRGCCLKCIHKTKVI